MQYDTRPYAQLTDGEKLASWESYQARNATKPRIWTGDHPKLDTLEAVAGVQILGSALKPGMVLLDPNLMTPAASLDKKVCSARNSGQVSFLALDYDHKTYETITVSARSMIWVAAR